MSHSEEKTYFGYIFGTNSPGTLKSFSVKRREEERTWGQYFNGNVVLGDNDCFDRWTVRNKWLIKVITTLKMDFTDLDDVESSRKGEGG
ncbi:hypothetical protein TNCV_3064191 [Trichonephila clavipes]|nr:hypothetical protein TNCV_3064191 [Trichonephila clavipes]